MCTPSLPSHIPQRLQDIPPESARICLKVGAFLEKTLGLRKPFPLCVAGLSGGADSSALAYILHLLGLPLVGVHLDHRLRPSSGEEAAYVARFADLIGIPCVHESIDISARAGKSGMGIEETGRHARYALFEKVRAEHGAGWIMTGHHLHDLAEDVLLRLVRGAGWPGLAGMRARDDARHILRPLLHTRREDLRKVLEHAGLAWCEDESNAQGAGRRNRIRLDVMPLLEKENPGFVEAVRKLWQLGRIDESFWEQATQAESDKANPQAQNSVVLPRTILEERHAAVRLRLYLASVRRLVASGEGQARIDALLQLDRAWQEGKTGKIIQLPGIDGRILKEGIEFSLRG